MNRYWGDSTHAAIQNTHKPGIAPSQATLLSIADKADFFHGAKVSRLHPDEIDSSAKHVSRLVELMLASLGESARKRFHFPTENVEHLNLDEIFLR